MAAESDSLGENPIQGMPESSYGGGEVEYNRDGSLIPYFEQQRFAENNRQPQWRDLTTCTGNHSDKCLSDVEIEQIRAQANIIELDDYLGITVSNEADFEVLIGLISDVKYLDHFRERFDVQRFDSIDPTTFVDPELLNRDLYTKEFVQKLEEFDFVNGEVPELRLVDGVLPSSDMLASRRIANWLNSKYTALVRDDLTQRFVGYLSSEEIRTMETTLNGIIAELEVNQNKIDTIIEEHELSHRSIWREEIRGKYVVANWVKELDIPNVFKLYEYRAAMENVDAIVKILQDLEFENLPNIIYLTLKSDTGFDFLIAFKFLSEKKILKKLSNSIFRTKISRVSDISIGKRDYRIIKFKGEVKAYGDTSYVSPTKMKKYIYKVRVPTLPYSLSDEMTKRKAALDMYEALAKQLDSHNVERQQEIVDYLAQEEEEIIIRMLEEYTRYVYPEQFRNMDTVRAGEFRFLSSRIDAMGREEIISMSLSYPEFVYFSELMDESKSLREYKTKVKELMLSEYRISERFVGRLRYSLGGSANRDDLKEFVDNIVACYPGGMLREKKNKIVLTRDINRYLEEIEDCEKARKTGQKLLQYEFNIKDNRYRFVFKINYDKKISKRAHNFQHPSTQIRKSNQVLIELGCSISNSSSWALKIEKMVDREWKDWYLILDCKYPITRTSAFLEFERIMSGRDLHLRDTFAYVHRGVGFDLISDVDFVGQQQIMTSGYFTGYEVSWSGSKSDDLLDISLVENLEDVLIQSLGDSYLEIPTSEILNVYLESKHISTKREGFTNLLRVSTDRLNRVELIEEILTPLGEKLPKQFRGTFGNPQGSFRKTFNTLEGITDIEHRENKLCQSLSLTLDHLRSLKEGVISKHRFKLIDTLVYWLVDVTNRTFDDCKFMLWKYLDQKLIPKYAQDLEHMLSYTYMDKL